MRFYGNLFLPRTEYNEVLWRNWLARSTVNREVAGSSPARTDFLSLVIWNGFVFDSDILDFKVNNK